MTDNNCITVTVPRGVAVPGGPRIKDSGERTHYPTGAVRDCKEGKGRCDLMPLDIVAKLCGSTTLDHLAQAKRGDADCLVYALRAFAVEQFKGSVEAMMLEVAKHFEAGAEKYGENNWQKGIPVHSYVDSAVRHYLKYRAGWTDEPHDLAFVWNVLCCLWTLKHLPKLDDWTEKKDKEE